MENKQLSIGVIGLGYVGIPLVSLFLEKGCRVYGIDHDDSKINQLNQHKSYLSDFTDAEMSQLFKRGLFHPSTSFESVGKVDAILLCVPTPLDKEYQPDLSYVKDALHSCLPFLRKQQLIVLESSTYPGTTEEEIVPIINSKGFTIGKDIFVAYSPERINPGEKVHLLEEIPKVVGGVTKNCTFMAKSIYDRAFREVVCVSSPRVAEMTKLVENAQRLINISFMNELMMLCDKMGISIWEVIDAASTKPFGFTPYYPGPGIGGHCIPIDPLYLSWKASDYQSNLQFIQYAHQINQNMPKYVVEKLKKNLLKYTGKSMSDTNIILIGLSYKKDINDVRESAALKVMKLLLDQGAQVMYHDPYNPTIKISNQSFHSIDLSSELLKTSDCSVILTDHSNIPYKLIVENSSFVLDTRNVTKEMKDIGNIIYI
ncbi:nucleotide sugar dehydrogenase [Litchfieldia salsa]|uniref:UDP-N-acetyl-D-glucosamine dehydrogenase n=1 Tax=Litchfieldia salsa TaxID=930152 RepID=A0A1H0WYE2_9BACI|nr:nucleotide sugar dehydrogenase [Litchfieldia salsa]SDP95640.1 UDP-N-acetyl-D-glucosamine dehydrogenase [Litchfieldia salsa]